MLVVSFRPIEHCVQVVTIIGVEVISVDVGQLDH
jgi:hypothetical protein